MVHSQKREQKREPGGIHAGKPDGTEATVRGVHPPPVTVTSYYNSANLCPSVRLPFDFHGNRSHDALRARPMCCSLPDDVPFLFEFVRMWSSYTIKRLCVVFASLHHQRRCGIPPTVSQEKFIPQLIARLGYRLTKNYIGYPKRYTKLNTHIYLYLYMGVKRSLATVRCHCSQTDGGTGRSPAIHPGWIPTSARVQRQRLCSPLVYRHGASRG